MKLIKKLKESKLQYAFIFFIISIIILIVIFPQLSMEYFLQGILIWGTKVLPALLPFFILTKLLSYTNFIKKIGSVFAPITTKLYGVNGIAGYVYFTSIISGYPVGAKITADLYKNGQVTQKDAHTISSFTSTSGPLFIVGTVCIGMFNDNKLGLIVLLSHLIGSIINGVIYKNKDKNTNITIQTIPQNILGESMSNSILSIMNIGGFIALFYMILQLLIAIKVFNLPIFILEKLGINSTITLSIFSGIIEVTSGCIILSKAILSFRTKLLIITFLISFGGLSIHAQAYTFLKTFNLPYKTFLIQKITHALISTTVAFVLSFLV